MKLLVVVMAAPHDNNQKTCLQPHFLFVKGELFYFPFILETFQQNATTRSTWIRLRTASLETLAQYKVNCYVSNVKAAILQAR